MWCVDLLSTTVGGQRSKLHLYKSHTHIHMLAPAYLCTLDVLAVTWSCFLFRCKKEVLLIVIITIIHIIVDTEVRFKNWTWKVVVKDDASSSTFVNDACKVPQDFHLLLVIKAVVAFWDPVHSYLVSSEFFVFILSNVRDCQSNQRGWVGDRVALMGDKMKVVKLSLYFHILFLNDLF